MRRLWLLLCALAWVLSTSEPAHANDVRGTAVFLDVGESVIEAELQLPLEQLTVALEAPPQRLEGAPELPLPEEALKAYVLRHFSAEARDARAFSTSVRSVRVEQVNDGPAVVARVTLRAPKDTQASFFTLHDDLIVHRVVTHNTYVFVRRDLRNAALGDAPVPVGLMHYQKTSLLVDRSGGSLWRGVGALFSLGTKHIAEGTDHLLFLFMLLLSAPLVATRGRWERAGSAARSLRETVKIVTAFTIGHSLTLVAVTVLGAELPSRPVEVLIALSILVTAGHAIRPLFAGREPLVAGGFGLVHGLGFASVLTGFGFDGRTLSASVLGFNLGVEAMQLAIVALTMPWLVLLSRNAGYRVLRLAGGALGAIASLGWIAERAFDVRTPIPSLVEAVAARAPWILAGLIVTALGLAVSGRAPGAPGAQAARQTSPAGAGPLSR